MSDTVRTSQTPDSKEYLPAERQDAILSLLTQQPVVKVPELAQLLHTTPITIRRDLAQLAEAGLLRRVRGGAMSVNAPDENPVSTIEPSTPICGLQTATHTPSASATPGGTIGVMFPEPSFFWPHAVEELTRQAAALNLRISIAESTYDPVEETSQLDTLARIPDIIGLIITPNAHPAVAENSWRWLQETPLPAVVIERQQPLHLDFLTDSVCTDHPAGARMAYWHFVQRGHTRVAAAFSSTPTAQLIEHGWEQITAANSALKCLFVEENIQPYEMDKIERLVQRIIDERVTGMLVHSDYLAIALAQALQRHGLRMPNDVSLISVDGFATMSTRPLTVLRSSPQALASEALNLLLRRLRSPESPGWHVWIDPQLIDNGSVRNLNA